MQVSNAEDYGNSCVAAVRPGAPLSRFIHRRRYRGTEGIALSLLRFRGSGALYELIQIFLGSSTPRGDPSGVNPEGDVTVS